MAFEAMMWQVDWAISFIIQENGLRHPITGHIFTAHLTALPRASILNSLYHCLTEDSSPLRKRFTSLRKLTMEAIEERNTIAHSAYGSSPTRDIATEGMEGYLQRHGSKGVSHRSETYTAEYLNHFARKCKMIGSANTVATVIVLGLDEDLSQLDKFIKRASDKSSG